MSSLHPDQHMKGRFAWRWVSLNARAKLNFGSGENCLDMLIEIAINIFAESFFFPFGRLRLGFYPAPSQKSLFARCCSLEMWEEKRWKCALGNFPNKDPFRVCRLRAEQASDMLTESWTCGRKQTQHPFCIICQTEPPELPLSGLTSSCF